MRQAQLAGLDVCQAQLAASLHVTVQCQFMTREEAGRTDGHSPRLVFMDIIVRDWGTPFLHQT